MWRVLYPAGIHYVLMFVITTMMVLIVAILGGDTARQMQASVWASAIAGLCAVPIAHFLIRRDERWRMPARRSHTLNLRSGIWMLLFGASAAYVLNMLLAILDVFEIFPEYGEISSQAYDQPFWILVLCAGIAAPIAEEYIFRGLIYQRLKDYMGVKWAILLSAVFFGIYHGNMVQFIYATILGILLAWMMEYFHSLTASILIHVGGNVNSFLMTSFGESLSKQANGIWMLLLIGVEILILVVSVSYLIHEKRQKKVK